jgi:hypothetical protein
MTDETAYTPPKVWTLLCCYVPKHMAASFFIHVGLECKSIFQRVRTLCRRASIDLIEPALHMG